MCVIKINVCNSVLYINYVKCKINLVLLKNNLPFLYAAVRFIDFSKLERTTRHYKAYYDIHYYIHIMAQILNVKRLHDTVIIKLNSNA